VLVAKGIVASDRIIDGKGMLLQTVCMLSGLVERFDESGLGLREEPVDYRVGWKEAGKEERKRQTKRQRKS
jgi:hypothetical protein